MANTSSAEKKIRVIARRTQVNSERRNRARTFVKKVEEMIKSGDKEQAREALRTAESELMRAAQKGVFHKKTASRKISRLSRRIKGMAVAS